MTLLLRLVDWFADRIPMVGWRVVALTLGAGIVWMGNRPRSELASIGGLPAGFDKVMHFTAFALFAAAIWRGLYPRVARRAPAIPHAWMLVILIPFLTGALDEFLQGFTPGRSRDVRDLAADTLGAICVCALGLWYRARAAGPRA